MRVLALAALLGLRAAAASAAPAPRAWDPYLHFNGAAATRYLWLPSQRREGFEYLYVLGARATAVKTDSYGLALQSGFTSFDTRRPIRGFASTGAGSVDAEPVFNFNTLYLDGYAPVAGRKTSGKFGVLPLELPTFQLPLRCMQVAALAGLRADVELAEAHKIGVITGNFIERQTQEVKFKIEGVREHYNYVNVWWDARTAWGVTRSGVYSFSRKIRPYTRDTASLFLQQETPLRGGSIIPRLYARYQTGDDLFADVVASVEGKFFDKKLWVRPGYIYVNRDRRAVPLPNSNYFTQGRDHNMIFLNVEAPFPRASDSLYAALTTGADHFLGWRETRFETGVFLRFADLTRP